MNILRRAALGPLHRAPQRQSLALRHTPLSPYRSQLAARSLASVQRPPRGRTARHTQDNDRLEEDEQDGVKAKPESPSFYTARPGYYDQLIQIQSAVTHVRRALQSLQLLPLPLFARASLPPLHPVWKGQEEMARDFKTRLTTSRYRRVIILLNELNDYNRIARAANCTDVANGIGDVVSMFESGQKTAHLAQSRRKAAVLDSYGRSYTLGKRKTSSARVWMIPTNSDTQPPISESESIEDMFGISPTLRQHIPVTTTTILVNNIPLAEYFPIPADRERITRPFKVAGVLGAYNVFALVRGGGTSGQSGALAHGIAKALVAQEPKLELILRRAKLLRRDPRMVERKKTGLAKARKRYTWVKR